MTKSSSFNLDAFRQSVLHDPLIYDIWNSKYRLIRPDGTSNESTVEDTRTRMVDGVYAKDSSEDARREAQEIAVHGYMTPGGRINAGAGSGRRVTMINCFVSDTIQDSMPGIQWAIARAALTMQQGGGIGVDYSTIRPWGARVGRTDSISSGALYFADQQDAMCKTIISAGTRRGAMMLTLRDDHPDLWNPDQFETITDYAGNVSLKHPSFISVKRQKGRLTQFNISVLVSDAFMKAVQNDEMWDLGFHVPPADTSSIVDTYDKPFPYDLYDLDNDLQRVSDTPLIRKGEMQPWYVYTRVNARVIWNDLMQSTYKYAEPGILFIDRINAQNNLYYAEEIRCTNPCGEQPLPPNGACDLGSVNLAFLVKDPFTQHASVDWGMLERSIRVGVRLLDNVLDTTNFPLTSQKAESDAKRRIGLGITGFADMCIQLGIRYGSAPCVSLVHQLGQFFRETAYHASMELAKERGPFALFDAEKFCAGYNVKQLSPALQEAIKVHGIRNGVLTTIAPNGTISMYLGNVSSGHEPVFSFHKTSRKVRQPDGTLKEYESVNYSYRMYEAIHGPTPIERLPNTFVGANDLSVDEHLSVHAAWQRYIDSSISKTINCATEMEFDAFAHVYDKAYEMGCKGCTTYRYDPDAGRGSVLSEIKPATPEPVVQPTNVPLLLERPAIVRGTTYKVKWPSSTAAYYVTINHALFQGMPRPIEIFITSKEVKHAEWIAALTRLISAIFRRGGDLKFLVHELKEVHSAVEGGYFIDQAFCPSLVALIGRTIEREFQSLGLLPSDQEPSVDADIELSDTPVAAGEPCPSCHAPTLVREQGCKKCLSCGHSTCG